MSVEDLIENAKLAEQTERYEDMAKHMKDFMGLGKESLTPEERNLLSVAYKNVVGTRRSAWRIISSIQQKETESLTGKLAKTYQDDIRIEVEEKCGEVLALIEGYLTRKESQEGENGEELVFFYKMKGDYYRYLVEVATEEKRENNIALSMKAYEKATTIAEANLPVTHPIRLGLALNFSVFYYEIKSDGNKACELAKEAFDNAISDLEKIQDETYKDSTLIMQLLRDNLTLWTSEKEDDDN